MPAMEKRKEKNGWMAVPQFGGWDQKAGGATNYSMVFSQARANRKQNKTDFKRSSLGNEEELIATQQVDSPSKRKKILSYFNCFIKA
ncbi:RPM1-interacting protein 4 (RIN4) family protein [Tasmannia lanceolata]|uniref:RPM1-interacting protein 4 (RIN4) family protein n=1 Tax=Tasmannia lanceolata TaxID=3420 RepID=UPI0040635926